MHEGEDAKTHHRSNNSLAGPSPDDDLSVGFVGKLLTAYHFVITDEAAAARDGSVHGLVMQAQAIMRVD